MIAAGTPGGGSDTPARILTQALSDQHGWRFVVDNRPGASGRIGTELAARAAPDGYTLLMASATPNAVVPSAVPNLPYDAINDFAPISLVAKSDFILSAHPSLPVRSVRDLIALAKKQPGEIRFASVGNISGAHVAGELLKQLAGIDIVHVPYKGPAPAITAILAGEVSLYFASGPSVTPHARSGRLRMLATASRTRSKMFPELPTVGETVPGHEASLWFGVMAPARTASGIVTALNAAIVAETAKPHVIEQLAKVGMESVSSAPEEFAAFVKAEIAKWAKVVKASGARIE
jgi:tripartite-type tricarboxylate transporter receptor subunit TctC